MKLISIDSLTTILSLFQQKFGLRKVAERHRKVIDACLLNIDYGIFAEDTSVGILGQGVLGVMTLGKDKEET